ncbi:MAG: sigma factor-like helix-turn-helix DNA-binding protein [Coprothermobacterota bacterium]|nr:sigma factor-like helix-turn-helix DNA-binding protein [Coprothermobacterota bacterium]
MFSRLNSIYGPLLTEKQREVLNLYLEQDLSLKEIGERLCISRQGVYDLIKRSLRTLTELESKLSFQQRLDHIRDQVLALLGDERMFDEKTLKELEEFFNV